MAGSKQDRAFAEKLRCAVSKGDVTIARRLIKGGVDINATFWYESTLLHEAVSAGKSEVVKLLIKEGADVNKPNQDGRTAFHLACRMGDPTIVKLLVDADAHVNARTEDNKTGLHIALWRGHINLVPDLLSAGARVNIRDQDGWSALHWAVYKPPLDKPTTQRLVERGAHINAADNCGRTPLHLSLHTSHWDVSQYLLQHGADPNITPKTKGYKLPQLDPTKFKLLQQAGLKGSLLPFLPPEMPLSCGESSSSSRVVPPLMELCRYRVRRTLNEAHGGRSVLPYVGGLPVPQVLRDYLTLKYELLENG